MVYKCSVCGYLFDEEKEGKSFSELTECPLCKQPVEKLEPVLPVEENKPEPDVEAAEEKSPETKPDGMIFLFWERS